MHEGILWQRDAIDQAHTALTHLFVDVNSDGFPSFRPLWGGKNNSELAALSSDGSVEKIDRGSGSAQKEH